MKTKELKELNKLIWKLEVLTECDESVVWTDNGEEVNAKDTLKDTLVELEKLKALLN